MDATRDLASTDGASGAATTQVTFESPRARGLGQPDLSLSYNSSSGDGEAGAGWTLSPPSIERRAPSGRPFPLDQAGTPYVSVERYVYEGRELIEICTVNADGNCKGAERLPTWVSNGWRYFRLRDDQSFARFFLAPNEATWRVGFKDGQTWEFGTPLIAPTMTESGMEVDPYVAGCIPRPPKGSDPGFVCPPPGFRWRLVRKFDLEGTAAGPQNLVLYSWSPMGSALYPSAGLRYLVDVFDTQSLTSFDQPFYGHRTHLTWEAPPYPTLTGQRIWRARPDRRLKTVDITSVPASGGARQLVRRYHLSYTEYHQHSYLASVQLEGRCEAPPSEPLAAVTGCQLSPPMTFEYSNPQYSHTPFKITNDQPFSTLGPLGLVDLNADGLVDFIEPVTATAQNVYFNALHGPSGLSADSIASPDLTSQGGANGTTLLAQSNLSIGADLRGNGTPQVFWYTGNPTPDRNGPDINENRETGWTFFPFRQNGSWSWRSVPNESRWMQEWGWNSLKQAYDGLQAHQLVGDIDGDGLIDAFSLAVDSTFAFIQYTSRDENGTYHPLLRSSRQYVGVGFPFVPGQVHHNDNCVLTGGAQDLADINGDGALDLYDVGKDGTVGFCPFGWHANGVTYLSRDGFDGFGDRQALAGVPSLAGIIQPFFHDLDGDGYADFIWTTGEGIGFSNNMGGASLLPETGVGGASWSPSALPWSAFPGGKGYQPGWQVTFADMNGNGIDDIVVFNGVSVWFVDVAKGTTDGYGNAAAMSSPAASAPRGGLLLRVSNGLGATTELTYMSTVDEQRLAAPFKPWKVGSPSVQSVVVRIVTTNGLPAPHAERRETRITHRDPIYDGWNHHLVGFEHVSVAEMGDSTVGTLITDTTYLRGGCADPYLDNCVTNPDDVLASVIGLPSLVEKSDATGVYYSTLHTTYSVDQTYTGIDGRHVRNVTPIASDTWLYDPTGPQSGGSTPPGVDVKKSNDVALLSSPIPIRSSTNQHLHTEQYAEAATGNVLSRSDFGVVDANGISVDGVIRTDYTWALYSPDYWTWRVHEVKVNQGVRDFVYEYDAHAHVTDVHAVLTGTAALDFHHEDPNAKVAAQPKGPAEGSTVHTASYGYDPFGNVVDVTAGGTCTHFDYTDNFALFAEVESHGCGTPGLPITRAFDFGFEVATVTTTSTGAVASAKYDELGRIVKAWGPDPITGAPSALLMTASYATTPNGPLHSVHTTTPTSDVWTYIDGLGQPFLSLHPADLQRGDTTAWIASGMVTRNARGGIARAFEPWFYTGQQPQSVPATTVAPSLATGATYDPLGRQLTATAIDGSVQMKHTYRSLSVDTFTAADLDGSRTPAPSTVVYDGHGRTTRALAQIHQPSHDVVWTDWAYDAAGGVLQVKQSHQVTSDVVVRTLRYDSLGRMVYNAEPNTSLNTGTVVSWPAPTPRVWRYAYDSSGHLLGTSDARGCGKVISYDPQGRVLAEDWSPCLSSQPAYTDATANAANSEVVYTYDVPEAGQTSDYGTNPAFLSGRLVAVADRGAHTRYAYDGAGRVTGVARQLATPLAASGAAPRAYAPTWYRTKATYDSANRLVRQTTGADVSDLLGFKDSVNDGASGGSAVGYHYTQRGVLSWIDGSYGTLVSGMTYDAMGRLQQATLGDAAKTKEQFFYNTDRLHRLAEHDISRGKGPWTTAAGYTAPTDGSTLQSDLVHNTFAYDSNSNPTMIADARPAGAWADGAKPVTRSMQHDDFGRVTNVTYNYGAVTGDKQAPLSNTASPVPSPPTLLNRVQTQSYNYDWLGNVMASDDDAHALYDRSLGAATTVANHPNQLGQTTMAGANGGTLTAQYDPAGNLSHLSVGRACAAIRVHTCLNSDFTFDWDEVGQLLRARRWDSSASAGSTAPAVDLGYAYSRGVRVLKSIAYNGDTNAGDTLYTAEIFNTLRLNHAHFAAGDYERTNATETAYLAGLARVVFAQTDLPSASSGRQHVFLEVRDEVGSTSAVIDMATGELVERSTSQIFGAPDSDYRTPRWANFHEDFRFSGKEDDAEVGLTYSGARYYHSALQRFISPDPLAIHGLAGDKNPYAYAAGSPLRYVDPSGLANGCLGKEQGCTDQTTMGPGGTPPVGQGGGGLDGLARDVSDVVDSIFGGHDAPKPYQPPPPTPREIIPPLPQPFHPFANESLLTRWINSNNSGMARYLQNDRALYRLQCNIATFTVGAEVTLATGGLLNALAGGSAMGMGASMSIRGAGQALLARMSGTALGTAATGSAAALNASGAAQEEEAVDETALFGQHLKNALDRFDVEGFTKPQADRLLTNPNLQAAFRGERIDTFFKESLANDPLLQHLQITQRFRFGPDVFDPATNTWWDVTTAGQWSAHVVKYSAAFGAGIPLIY